MRLHFPHLSDKSKLLLAFIIGGILMMLWGCNNQPAPQPDMKAKKVTVSDTTRTKAVIVTN